MKVFLKTVLVCAFWSVSVWGSAGVGPEEVAFTDDQKTILAHVARFEDGALLNDYVDGMTTFWRQDNFPEVSPGVRAGYCQAIYGAYSLLLKGIAHPPSQWMPFAQEVIGLIEKAHPELFIHASKTAPHLDASKLQQMAQMLETQLMRMRAQEPFSVKDAIITSTQRDLVSLIALYLGGEGTQKIRDLLLLANGELAKLRKSEKESTRSYMKVPDGLENAVKTLSPNWDDILLRIQTEDVPEIRDPNAHARELSHSLALLEKAKGAVATLSKAMQENHETIVQLQRYKSVITPTITLQDPLAQFFLQSPTTYPFPAASGFLAALQVYFSGGDTSHFGVKFSELCAIYKDNTVDACVADWFANACGAHVKGFLPLYENWRRGVSSSGYASWDNAFFFPILKHYLSWWTACTFAQSQGEGALMPREAFALAYTAWREVDMVVWTQNGGAAPAGFTLTTDDKKNLALMPPMKDVWNPPATLAIEETSS